MSVPVHIVPFVWLPVSVHVETPVAHEVVPLWHGFVGVHATFAAQAAQDPALQTMLVPQDIPLLAAVIMSVHVATPPAHDEMVPAWHAFAGVQGLPTAQAEHTPPEQTIALPHGVPSFALPVSVHTAAPVVQTYTLFLHELATEQSPPELHAVQTPWLQTLPVAPPSPASPPHEIPLDAAWTEPQLATPASSQVVCPTLHSPGMQVAPGTHLEESPTFWPASLASSPSVRSPPCITSDAVVASRSALPSGVGSDEPSAPASKTVKSWIPKMLEHPVIADAEAIATVTPHVASANLIA